MRAGRRARALAAASAIAGLVSASAAYDQTGRVSDLPPISTVPPGGRVLIVTPGVQGSLGLAAPGSIFQAGEAIATTSAPGVVQPDGSTIYITSQGVISVPLGSASAPGLLQADGTSLGVAAGVISIKALPAPQATVLGGVESIASVAHNWISYIDTTGAPHLAQPAFADISGAAVCGQLPSLSGDLTSTGCATALAASGVAAGSYGSAIVIPGYTVDAKGRITAEANYTIPTATAAQLGLVKPDGSSILVSAGVLSATASSVGAVSASTPQAAHAALMGPSSGSAAAPSFRPMVGSDLPLPTATSLGGVQSDSATAHQWLTYLDVTGVLHQSQPAAADLSNGVTGSGAVVLAGGYPVFGTAPQAPAIRLTDNSGSYYLTLNDNETLTANRLLNLVVNNQNLSINLGGNLTLGGSLTTSGTSGLTVTTTGVTNVTVPAGSHTLSGLDVAETWTAPKTAKAPIVDGSGASPYALTSAGYTIPASSSLARLKPTAAVTATLTLPSAIGDGQPLYIDNISAYSITATFSPAVNGWTNGATLAGPSGVRLRWDAYTSQWDREQ